MLTIRVILRSTVRRSGRMSDLILKLKNDNVHVTFNDDPDRLVVIIQGASANEYFNRAESLVDNAIRKLMQTKVSKLTKTVINDKKLKKGGGWRLL